MLAGQALVDFVEENQKMKLKDQAREAGYVRVTKLGKEQVLQKDFTHALLAAKGLNIPRSRSIGRSVCFETTVHQTGLIMVGRPYCEKFGVRPGDVMVIKVEDDAIVLKPKVEAAPVGKGKA